MQADAVLLGGKLRQCKQDVDQQSGNHQVLNSEQLLHVHRCCVVIVVECLCLFVCVCVSSCECVFVCVCVCVLCCLVRVVVFVCVPACPPVCLAVYTEICLYV